MRPADPDNIITVIADKRRELDELKTAQRVGPASLVVNTYMTGATVDAGATIAAGGSTNLRVRFTTLNQPYPLLTLDVYVYTDSAAQHLVLLPMQIEQRLTTTPGEAVWDATIENTDDLNAATYYFKVAVVALDAGALS
jgi:hypothetical protein